MNNNIDKLFKDKLDNHQLSPSPLAWEKIQANLPKKNNKLIWFRMAAVLGLAALCLGALVWGSLQWGKQTPFTANNPKEKKPMEMPSHAPDTLAISSQKMAYKNLVKAKRQVQLSTSPIKEKSKPTITTDSTTHLEVADPIVTEIIQVADNPIAANAARPVVIEYRLEAPPATSDITNLVASADNPKEKEKEKEKSYFTKALALAREAKNADHPLLGLRLAKDNLFALNFKKEKNTKTNIN